MADISELSDDELKQLYHQWSAAGPRGVKPTPGMTWRREYDPTSSEWQAKYGPTAGIGEGELTREGIGQGMTNVARHVGNLVGLESNKDLANAKQLDAPLLTQGAGKFGSMTGESAILAPLLMGGGAALGATAPGAAVMGSPIARGVLEGAAQGGLMSDPGDRARGALMGAATGAALPVAAGVGTRATYGIRRTPAAQELLDRQVRLTPGQMNPEGLVNKLEENLRGVPVVGNLIENARNQAQRDFQRGVIQESGAPGFQLNNPSHDVNELFTDAQNSYRPLYQQAEGHPVRPFLPQQNQTLAYALRQATQNRRVGAGEEIRNNASEFVQGQLEAEHERAVANGGWQSQNLIRLRSAINEEIRAAGPDQSGRKYRQLLQGARDQVTNSIEQQIPADASQALRTANDAYPNLAIIRDAIKRGGDQANGFTPAQLSAAVKQATDTNEYAQGGGLLRDWSGPGRDIFTERNPKTGHAWGTLGTLAAGAGAVHHFAPELAAASAPLAGVGALTGLGLVATPVGRRLVSGQTVGQRGAQRLAEGLQRMTSQDARRLAGTAAGAAINRGIPYYLNPSSGDGTGNP